MTPETTPTMEYYRATVRAVGCHIIVEYMVAPECLSETACIGTRKVLLPVKPPEVYTLSFMLSDYSAEERIGEVGIVKIPGYNFTSRSVNIIFSAKKLIHSCKKLRRFLTAYTIGGMKI